jgi:MarR family 2-MHQ and catechol resistance regulon transcriptional repressor
MVIDNLEKRNLVRRERDENDRRSFIVRLTEAGNKLIRKIFPPHAEVITAEMNALTAAEQKTLGELCKKLGLRDKA